MPEHRNDPTPDEAARLAERLRLESLGRITGELVHDLANDITALEARARLAAGEARAGRPSLGELERVVEGAADAGAMLRDVLEVLRGERISPEVTVEAKPLVERVIRRMLPSCRPLEIRLHSSLPAGVEVPGRASFLTRAVRNLLANAARHADREVRVEMDLSLHDASAAGGRAVLLLAVEDDGPGIPESQAAALFLPLSRGLEGGTGLGLSSAAWAVAQLGGMLDHRAGGALGGARFEVRLPCFVRGEEDGGRPLAGHRVVILERAPGMEEAVGTRLLDQGAEVLRVSSAGGGEDELLAALMRGRPDAVLLDPEVCEGTGVRLWERLSRLDPRTAERVVFLARLEPGDALLESARRTGRPVIPQPADLLSLSRTLERLVRR